MISLRGVLLLTLWLCSVSPVRAEKWQFNHYQASPDGEWLAGLTEQGVLHLWQFRQRRAVHVFQQSQVSAFSWYQHRLLLAGEHSWQWLNPATAHIEQSIARPCIESLCTPGGLQVSPGQNWLLSQYGKKQVLWALPELTPLFPFKRQRKLLRADHNHFLPDGKALLVATHNTSLGRFYRWDLKTGHYPIHPRPYFQSPLQGMAVSPSGQKMFWADAQGLHLWDLQKEVDIPLPESVQRFKANVTRRYLSFADTEDQILIGANWDHPVGVPGTLHRLDLRDGQVRGMRSGLYQLQNLLPGPSSHILLAAYTHGKFEVWDAPQFKTLCSVDLPGPQQPQAQTDCAPTQFR